MDRPPLLTLPCNDPTHDHGHHDGFEVHIRESVELPPEAIAAVRAAPPDQERIEVPGYGILIRIPEEIQEALGVLAGPPPDPLRPVDPEEDRLPAAVLMAAPLPLKVTSHLAMLLESGEAEAERGNAAFEAVIAQAERLAPLTSLEEVEALMAAVADTLARYAPRG